MINRITQLFRTEMHGIHPRLLLAQCLAWPLPFYAGGRWRAGLLRFCGFQIGQGTVIWGTPVITGDNNLYKRLIMGKECWINIGCFFDLGDTITIGDRAGCGQEVMILTTSHQMGDSYRRVGPVQTKPVHIEAGVWLGARCTVLPGVTIHEGAVVAAGAVVTKDVPPNTVVAGIPATAVRQLTPYEITLNTNYSHSSSAHRDQEG